MQQHRILNRPRDPWVTKNRMIYTRTQRFQYGRRRREIHVGHPHGQNVLTVRGSAGIAPPLEGIIMRRAQPVDRYIKVEIGHGDIIAIKTQPRADRSGGAVCSN